VKYLILLLLFPLNSISQTTIKGNLKTKTGDPVYGASITITEVNSENIIAYDISNNDGNFSISIDNENTQLQINIRSVGFESIIDILDNKTQIKDYLLTESITELKEIVLKNSPITRKGDTINYSVKAFSKQEDRTIGDVLNNLPGIEVLPNGKILYQGKPINKYYIEGLDLLEGKYNLANKNLPHREVAKVQILENHQPIKLLDSLVSSDRAALNIKLKNSYTFTGQAEIGTGVSPLLWDLNLTPILFSKKYQILNSYQANNTGDNIVSQLKTLTIDNLLEQFENNDEKQDWLSIQQLRTPAFSEARWLDNNTHLITTNALVKLKKDYELRLNASYINDNIQRNGFTNTQFFTTNDTIALFETNSNQLFSNSLETNLTIQRNTSKNYLKNSLKFQGFWDSQRGIVQTNNNNIVQNLDNRYFKLSNQFRTFFSVGKQILTLSSYLRLSETPQDLIVSPGQFNNLLNNGNSFYTNNSISFTKGKKQLSFSSKLGFQFENQNLLSDIIISPGQSLDNLFTNNLEWIRSKAYLSSKIQYKLRKWRFELALPINLYNYDIEDTQLQQEEELSRFTLEPNLSINYNLNSFWKLNTSVRISNDFGKINQFFYGYILQSYRNIQRIDAPLPQMRNINYSSFISYRNPIKSLFFNFSYTYALTENNLLFENQILDDGSIELQAVPLNNDRVNHNFSARASKYFSKLNANLSLGLNYNLQDVIQIINSESADISNENWQLNGKIDKDITDWINTEIESVVQFSNNEVQNQSNQTITQQSHKLKLNIYPKKNHYFAVNAEYIRNNLFSVNTENLFADALYRYTWKKKDIDFELKWSNIFNTLNYQTINIDNFSYIETNFELRPAQVLFKVRFSI